MSVLPALPDVDVVITSPPYNLGSAPWARLGHWKPGRAKWKADAEGGSAVLYGARDDALPWADYVAWQQDVLRRLWAKLTPRDAIFFPPYFWLRDYGEGQIGHEPTVADFVTVLADVFDEVKRVLRPDGVLWLNLGTATIAATGSQKVEIHRHRAISVA